MRTTNKIQFILILVVYKETALTFHIHLYILDDGNMRNLEKFRMWNCNT